MTLDLIIDGGRMIDGTGRPSDRHADVGISRGRIVAIGDLAGMESAERLSAEGCIVAPGFIDIHSHSDFTLLVDPRARSAVAQGVTTEIVGNCGHGCAPIGGASGQRRPETEAVNAVSHNIYGYSTLVDISWTSVGGYLDRLSEARTAVNVGTLVPNGNLRLAAMKHPAPSSGPMTREAPTDRPARPEEVRHMARLLAEGLADGALGFSTGLEYASERAASEDEIVALCRIAAREGGFYATHTRNLDIEALKGIEEAVAVARAAEVPLQISHIIPRRVSAGASADGESASARGSAPPDWQRALELVDTARARGADVTFDAHTRLHGTTNVSAVLPPGELRYRGEELRARLRDPEVRAQVKRYPSLIASWGLAGWDRAFLLTCPHHPEWAGKSVAELAGPHRDPMDALLDVLIAEADDPHAPMAYSHSRDEGWLLGTMRHPLCMVGSDAIDLATDGLLADTTFLGAYTWVGWYLRRLVRETGVLSWEQAIHRLTDLPAQRAGLVGRGRIYEGAFADVVVFDPKVVGEQGSLDDPNRYARGFRHVVVNGTPALANGEFRQRRTGMVLRRAA